MDELKREDYAIRHCDTCTNPTRFIDMDRIIRRLNEHFDKKEFEQAERLLDYWIVEAVNGNDKKGELQLRNEYMGLARKLGKEEKAFLHVTRADELLRELGLDKNVSGATIYVNIATVYKAFGNSEKAIPYFNKAKEIYEIELPTNDKKLSALYNNMALALVDLNQLEAADTYYTKAEEVLDMFEDGKIDEAISLLNHADLLYKRYKLDVSEDYQKYENNIHNKIERAWKLIDDISNVRDEYYRYVCEKCAPSFGFYGYFLYQKELERRSKVSE